MKNEHLNEKVAVHEVEIKNLKEVDVKLETTKAPLDRFLKIEGFFEKLTYGLLGLIGTALVFILKAYLSR